MRLYISMFLFFPWHDGFTSVWNDLTEKQMAERSKYNFAHVLNGVVFYKVPFAQKAVLHSLYRLAKNIFKKSSFQYISSLWIFGTTNTSILRFPWTVSIEPVGYPGSTSTKSVLYEFFKVFNDNQTLMAKNKHLGKKTYMERKDEGKMEISE